MPTQECTRRIQPPAWWNNLFQKPPIAEWTPGEYYTQGFGTLRDASVSSGSQRDEPDPPVTLLHVPATATHAGATVEQRAPYGLLTVQTVRTIALPTPARLTDQDAARLHQDVAQALTVLKTGG